MATDPTSSIKLPQYPEPYWREFVDLPSFKKITGNTKTDVVIVGAGISGITAAYLLIKEGVQVALLEAGNILNGTTGHTTAKVTAQHDIIYNELINHFGLEKARLYYEANNSALQFIKDTINGSKIECGLTAEDAYIYTNSDKEVKKLSDEYSAYQKLDIPGEHVNSIPLPLPIKAALVMKDQAQFHPLQYLVALVRYIAKAGGSIYENTTVIDIEKGSELKVITRDGHKISCNHVILASHFPFYDGTGFYFARMYAERSYVLGIKSKDRFPRGMYINAENPTRSLRYVPLDNGKQLILIIGENHKTGQGIPTIKHYEALQAFAQKTFSNIEIPYRWSTQDLTTIDKIPYIGRITSDAPNIFVATGYRKWGMTSGTAAALLLRDLIMQKDNPYAELYTPSRFNADPGLKNLILQNVDVAAHLIEGKFEMILPGPEDMPKGEGQVVRVDGTRAGAYRDDEGKLYLVDNTCTHMGCELNWNSGDRTWDCPCHGSRFSYEGSIIEGPALSRLRQPGEGRNKVEPAVIHDFPDSN